MVADGDIEAVVVECKNETKGHWQWRKSNFVVKGQSTMLLKLIWQANYGVTREHNLQNTVCVVDGSDVGYQRKVRSFRYAIEFFLVWIEW